MASYSYSINYGDWVNTITINYTTSYNSSTNETTVTFGNVNWAYFGKSGWGTSAASTITVTAADNTSSAGSVSASISSSTNGGVKTFTAAPNPTSVTVKHNGAAGTKSVNISISSSIFVNPTGGGSQQYTIKGDSTTTAVSATTYALTISQGSNTSITVKRGSSTLSNGAILLAGDSLVITFGTSTGYTLTTHTVNGNTFTSGNTYSVSGNVTVKSAATLATYTLTIDQGVGTSISVKKGSDTLTNNATIYYGDSLTISITANTGYSLTTNTVNGNNFTSGTYTVTGATVVAATASVLSYEITIPTVDNCSFSILRTSSPLQGASTGALANNSTIYYNDIISITAETSPGYGLSALTVNNVPFENGGSITVNDNITISATVIVTTTYKLRITQKDDSGTGELITVRNGDTPVVNGDSIIEGSQLTYTISIPDGYWVKNFNINGNLKYVKTDITFTIETAPNPVIDTSFLSNMVIPIIKTV